ncbi:MAG TPA: hypothetical protein V6C91_21060 [Coleofasciculaceae cyanobacterium]
MSSFLKLCVLSAIALALAEHHYYYLHHRNPLTPLDLEAVQQTFLEIIERLKTKPFVQPSRLFHWTEDCLR